MVLLGVDEDGLEGPAQEVLVEVVGGADERTQRRRDLHLHAGEVLKQRRRRSWVRIPQPGKDYFLLNLSLIALVQLFCSSIFVLTSGRCWCIALRKCVADAP